MNTQRQLQRNFHFVAQLSAFPGDGPGATNSFWVCGTQVRVLDQSGNYTDKHGADVQAVLAHAQKLAYQERVQLAHDERHAGLSLVAEARKPTKPTLAKWSKGPEALLDAMLALDLDKVRCFQSEAAEAASRFGLVLDFLIDGFLANQVCNAQLMRDLDDREGSLLYAKLLIEDVSEIMLESMISECTKSAG
jgi:hypothetical protein